MIVRSYLAALFLAALNASAAETVRSKASIWTPPAGTSANGTWSVAVRDRGGEWKPLFVYAAKMGHQSKDDPLAKSVGLVYNGPRDTSLVKFDFEGELEVRAQYRKGTLSRFAVSPVSYGIPVRKEGNTLYFSMAQNAAAPRKIVIRANDNWEEDCLHIITNPMEQNVPDENDPNVLVLRPGQEIPRTLPKQKSMYYFKPGVHVLPRGVWVDYDLGTAKRIDRFDLISGPPRPFIVPGGQNYRIEYRTRADEPWRIACENLKNAAIDPVKVRFPAVSARFVRLTLLGNTTDDRRTGGFGYLHANHITAFRLYPEGSDVDCAAGKAADGAVAGFGKTSAPGNTSFYGSVHSAEAFFINRGDVTFYIAPGAVVKGAIRGDGLSNVTIRGRGILDATDLVHELSSNCGEGRTSALRLEGGSNIVVEGITVLDSPMWAIVLSKSQNASVRNIDFFGSIVNADGIHMSAVTNGLVDGCFLRSTDDLFVMYHYGPGKKVTVRNTVMWTDGGRAVLLGLAAAKGDIERIRFENIDMPNIQNVWDMDAHGGAIHLVASGGNTIRDIHFKDIRIEPFRFPTIASVLQVKSRKKLPGKVESIVFENLSYGGSGEYRSYLAGVSDAESVSNVVFKNCTWGKKRLDSGNPQLEIRPYVFDIRFIKE